MHAVTSKMSCHQHQNEFCGIYTLDILARACAVPPKPLVVVMNSASMINLRTVVILMAIVVVSTTGIMLIVFE